VSADFGEEVVRAAYDREEALILDEFLAHGRAVRAERARAAEAGEKPDFIPLVRAWGGVCICYRKSMLDSPAYRLNHEEVIKSLEEGIDYAEKPLAVGGVHDEFGHVQSLLFESRSSRTGGGKTPADRRASGALRDGRRPEPLRT
jgi:hypothetical protein